MQEQSQERAVPTQPVPVGISWDVQEFSNSAGERRSFVALYIETPMGTNVFYMPPTNAKEMAAGVDGAADVAASVDHGGIIVPGIAPPTQLNGEGGVQ